MSDELNPTAPVDAPVVDAQPVVDATPSIDAPATEVTVTDVVTPEATAPVETPADADATEVAPVSDIPDTVADGAVDPVEIVINKVVAAIEATDPDVPAHVEIALSVIPAQHGLPAFPL